jgi:hypothetical protein
MSFISYTCWVLYVLTLVIFFACCCYVLLLRRWGVCGWRFILGVRNPRSTACGKMGSIPLFSPFWTCNKFFFVIRYDIIKTLVFCAYILTVCMTTWSWTYIRWASGFGLKNRVWHAAQNLNKKLWKLKVPLKIMFFFWYLRRGVVFTKDSLAKLNWQGSVLCCFCHKDETIQHLFFDCPLARSIWSII